MGATANASNNVGFWVFDAGTRTWGPGGAAAAALATFQYDSNITCDAAAQPGNPVKTPAAPAAKFAGPPPVAKRWGFVRTPLAGPFAGPLGSTGRTQANGSSRVLAGPSYEAQCTARARVTIAAAAGAAATAISTVIDPWRFNYSATGDSKLRRMIGIRLSLGGSLTPPQDAKLSRASIVIQGDMGSISLTVDGRSGRFRPVVRIDSGWKAYIGRIVIRRRVPVPRAASVADIRNLLAQGFDPQTQSWRSRGRRLSITFVKDLGSQSGRITMGTNVVAQEEAKGAAPYKPPYKPYKQGATQRKQPK